MFKNIFYSGGPKKVGLALSGGITRGLAHIGVLKVLEKNNIPIDYIAGTSMGSLIGALYASGLSPLKMEAIALRTTWSKLLSLSFSLRGPLSAEGIYRFVENRIGKNASFKDLKIPYKAVSADLLTGTTYIFETGSVAKAVQASCSIPGIFTPVSYEGRLLVDGGLVDNLPSSTVREMGADIVIAVDCVNYAELSQNPKNAFDVIGRFLDLMLKKMGEEGRKLADIVIEPESDESAWNFDLSKAGYMIEKGEAAAIKVMREIEKKIQ